MVVQKKRFALILCLIGLVLHAQHDTGDALALQSTVHKKRAWKIKDCFAAQAVRDIVSLHQYIFHWDTLKVISTTFPAYMLLRMFDDDIQSAFYHGHCLKQCHKDVHQAPRWCEDMAQYGIAFPIAVMFGSLFVGDLQLRTTSWMFLLGVPFVVFGKDVFKKIRFDAAQRPWREQFGSDHRSFGGFPSGHMAEVTYLTVLYGLRYGVRAAGPLVVASTFLCVTFLNCNRHYASQMIAGAGIGTIFALSANKVIEAKLSHTQPIEMNLDVSSKGSPALSIGWSF